MQISNLIGSSPAPMTQPSNVMSPQPQQSRATIGGNLQAPMVGQGSLRVGHTRRPLCEEVLQPFPQAFAPAVDPQIKERLNLVQDLELDDVVVTTPIVPASFHGRCRHGSHLGSKFQ